MTADEITKHKKHRQHYSRTQITPLPSTTTPPSDTPSPPPDTYTRRLGDHAKVSYSTKFAAAATYLATTALEPGSAFSTVRRRPTGTAFAGG